MAKALVIVESPAKAKTINKYLGRDYKVIASMGHVRDLPKSKLGVDVDAGFEPEYVVIPDRQKVIKELKDAAKGADEIFVATDPDREGEAIGWHLSEELGASRKKVRRLMFNEITKKAILEAIKHPGTIDMKMVDAQQARRVLDRLVGYKISPILWDKVRRGLSAGRVQSVALKLICDREREIEAFVAEEYWHIFARLAADEPPEFDAKLVKKGDSAVKVGNEAEAQAILSDLSSATFVVSSVATKERKKHAVPPFITSKLQQASRFPVKKTMMVAQQLYEGIELPGEEAAVGLITYMRTDSVRVADQALDEVRGFIGSTVRRRLSARTGQPLQGEIDRAGRARGDPADVDAVPPGRGARAAQRRPVLPLPADLEPVRRVADDPGGVRRHDGGHHRRRLHLPREGIGPEVRRLARGVWAGHDRGRGERADRAAVTGADGPGRARRGTVERAAAGDARRADAGRQSDPARTEVHAAPGALQRSDARQGARRRRHRPSEHLRVDHFGAAGPRLCEQESRPGSGRPSSGAGSSIACCIPAFDDILDVEYTAKMEEQLDEIEKGKADYKETLAAFYQKFKKDLKRASKEMPNFKEGQPLDPSMPCDKCGQGEMVEKAGRFGIFLACSRYPDCDNTKELETADTSTEELDETCENCGRPMVVKRGRFGMFLACTGYPECKTTRKIISTKQGVKAAQPDQVLDEICPNCGKNLVVKHGRFGEFTACTGYPECKYVKLKSTGVICPKDGGDVVERKSRRGKVFYGCANYPKCDFTLWNKPILEPCPKCGWKFLTEKITKRYGRQLICANEACDYVRAEELATAEA